MDSSEDDPWLWRDCTDDTDGLREPGKAGYGCHEFEYMCGEVCIFPFEDRGLRTDVLDGAGEGMQGYAMSCGDCIAGTSGYCAPVAGIWGKGWINAGSVDC